MLGGTVAVDCDIPAMGIEFLPVNPPNNVLDVAW